MNRFLCLAVILAVAHAAHADGPGVSLRINDESAPSGSAVQIKIDVTEPKPISSGRGKIRVRGSRAIAIAVDAQGSSGLTIEGVALMNDGQDTYGVATIDGDELSFDIVSPSSTFGTPVDAPILAIAARLPSGAANGSTFPVSMDPSAIGFRDPSGTLYPYEIQNGTLTVSSVAISISDVSFAGAEVPAGGVVSISGANFTPGTRIEVSEVAIAQQQFVSNSRIDLRLGQPARMHGRRIRARNDGKNGEARSECEYFAFRRTTAIGSSDDAIFRNTIPLFATAAHTEATVDLPRRASRKHRAMRPSRGSGAERAVAGFALQNLQHSTASVSIELLDTRGNPYAVNTISIGPDQSVVREIREVFGTVSPPSAFRIRSNIPVQVLGLTGDPSTGTAAALPPG